MITTTDICPWSSHFFFICISP